MRLGAKDPKEGYNLRLIIVFNSSMAKFKMELSNCFEFYFCFRTEILIY